MIFLHALQDLVRQCVYIFGAEVLIDLCKHAVLCKFNDVKPGVYRHFMRVRCWLVFV